MSSRTRMLGAGRAGSTVYGSNVNMIQFGDKLQGLAPQATHFFISGNGKAGWYQYQTRTYAPKRNYVFCMNQLGGVGKGKSQFKVRGLNNPDGAKLCKPYEYKSISDDKSESNDENTMNNYVTGSVVNTEEKPQDPLLGSLTQTEFGAKISSDSTLTSTDGSEAWQKFYFSAIDEEADYNNYSEEDFESPWGTITKDPTAYQVFLLKVDPDKHPNGVPFNVQIFSKFNADYLTYPIVKTNKNRPPLYFYTSPGYKQTNWVGDWGGQAPSCPNPHPTNDGCIKIDLPELQDPVFGSKTESDSSYTMNMDSTLTSTDDSKTWQLFYFSGVDENGNAPYSETDFKSPYGTITRDTSYDGKNNVFVLTADVDGGAPFNEQIFSTFNAPFISYPVQSSSTNTPALYMYDNSQVDWVGQQNGKTCPFPTNGHCVKIEL